MTPTDLDCDAYASDLGRNTDGGATQATYRSRYDQCANHNKNVPNESNYTTINVGGAQEQAANLCQYKVYYLGSAGSPAHLYISNGGETWRSEGAPRDIMCAVCP